MKMTNKRSSHHLVKVFVWNENTRVSSYESIKENNTIKDILNKLQINNINIFSFLGHEKIPFKLKSCNLDEKIIDLFFYLNSSYENKYKFWNKQTFTEYSIHLFNYNPINSINDETNIWNQLKTKFNIKGLDGNRFWTQIQIT
jgi:hypothetical protein